MKFIQLEKVDEEFFFQEEDDIDYESLGIERPRKTIDYKEIPFVGIQVNVDNIDWFQTVTDDEGNSITNVYMSSGDAICINLSEEELLHKIQQL